MSSTILHSEASKLSLIKIAARRTILRMPLCKDSRVGIHSSLGDAVCWQHRWHVPPASRLSSLQSCRNLFTISSILFSFSVSTSPSWFLTSSLGILRSSPRREEMLTILAPQVESLRSGRRTSVVALTP
ncbi:unnamed protein product [Linum trigynum]|uniref:Uncharacterized protein n=1 Tax=Linum trigynum TaxID=586398 RepID=A0AAV2CH81_9ROSI